MKTPQLPEVNWCQLYGKLSEAVDHAGFTIHTHEDGYINLIPKADAVHDCPNCLSATCPKCNPETQDAYCERMGKESAQEADGSVESVVYASHKNLSAQEGN